MVFDKPGWNHNPRVGGLQRFMSAMGQERLYR